MTRARDLGDNGHFPPSGLTDVILTGSPLPTTDDLLTYDGANWKNKTLNIVGDSTPQLGGDLDVNGSSIVGLSATTPIEDTNGNELISFVVNAVAQAGIVIENSTSQLAGAGPTITVQSGATNTGIHIEPKGAGYMYLGGTTAGAYVIIQADATFRKSVQIKENASEPSNAYSGYVRLFALSSDAQLYSKDDAGNVKLLSVETLGQLTDVDLTGSPGPTADDLLQYDGANWTFATPEPTPAGLNTQTGTSYGPDINDANIMITMNNASANTVTIPANASVAYPINTELHFMQLGAGQTTIAITTDTLNVESTLTLKLTGQYAVATAKKMTSTMWVLFGNLEAA